MKPKPSLASLVTRSSLEKQAGERYFARGVAYLRAGAVAHLHADERGIWARVVGTEPYVTRLWIEAGKLEWGCTCPLGMDGAFCKHLVAAGLAWLSRRHRNSEPRPTRELEAIRGLLAETDRDALAGILFERVLWDEGLLNELLLEAWARSPTRGRSPKGGR